MNIPEIYVLWHPSCLLAAVLAPRIHAWFRPGNGLGPQVYYRSLPAPHAPPGSLPTPLPREPRAPSPGPEEATRSTTNLQIVLVLIDEHLVVDSAWRYWLATLKIQDLNGRRILPVALDATAYNMPPELRELNYLRPKGLPLSDAADLSVPDTEAALQACIKERSGIPLTEVEQSVVTKAKPKIEVIVVSLLKQLTESLARILIFAPKSKPTSPDSARAEPPKVSIFLSHAKADGQMPAQRLRDYIYSQTQMAAFYDENDIAFGSVFSKVIEHDLGSAGTAALIAVRSANYARRPWCRREVSLFRQPKPETLDVQGYPGYERWRLYPLLVVEAMDESQNSLGIPEFGNAPVIRWSATTPQIEERIVTTVIRDALLTAYHSALAATIPKAPDRIVINWLPDPTTLLHLKSIWGSQQLDIVHPGQGLSGAELDVLNEFFPKLTFHSFEEMLT